MAATETQESVEAIERVLTYLVVERQSLRERSASRVELEANRQAIVVMQDRLSRALGKRFASR